MTIKVEYHVDDYHHSETFTSSSESQVNDIITDIMIKWDGCAFKVTHVEGTSVWYVRVE